MATVQHMAEQLEWQIVEDLVAERVATGAAVAMVVGTGSMAPLLRPGDRIQVSKPTATTLVTGAIIVVHGGPRPIVHRLVRREWGNSTACIITKGDASGCCDPAKPLDQVIGVVTAVERQHRQLALTTPAMGWLGARIAWSSRLTACAPGSRRTPWQRGLLHSYRAALHLIAAVVWLDA
jgi:hypothetical protein